ncbi:MAG TPA: hypothetical protein VLA04_05005 [Verrucomicrobiae bacterium]|nr:hypothetical protein [Verrucomicrobiae bacterium]
MPKNRPVLHAISPRTKTCSYSGLAITAGTAQQIAASPRVNALKGTDGRWLTQGDWIHGPHFRQILRKAGYEFR